VGKFWPADETVSCKKNKIKIKKNKKGNVEPSVNNETYQILKLNL